MEIIHFDKWVHFGIFTILTFGICWAAKTSGTKTLVSVLVFAMLYGICVEIIQDQFIINRSFDIGDWAADTAGSISGVWFWKIRYKKK